MTFSPPCCLYVPKDIPEPNEPYYQKNVEQAIVSLVQATEGRALVLFTSNSQLNATYRATHAVLEKEGIIVSRTGHRWIPTADPGEFSHDAACRVDGNTQLSGKASTLWVNRSVA